MAKNNSFPVDSRDIANDVAGKVRGGSNLNDALPVEEITTLFQFEPQPIALKRDVQTETGGGVVGFNPSFGSIDTIGFETDGTSQNSQAGDETATRVIYKSGHRMEAGIRCLVNELQGSGVAEWGMGEVDGNNRLMFREEAQLDEVRCAIVRDGVMTELPESGWKDNTVRDLENENGNVDYQVVGYNPFDSNSTIGTSLDTSFGYVYKIDFVWYGQGIIIFSILAVNGDGKQEKVPVAGFIPKGKTSLPEINLPIYATCRNNGTAARQRINIAGRQAWFAGRRRAPTPPARHVITSPPSISNTSYTTIALVRKTSMGEQVPSEITEVEVLGGGDYDIEVRGRVEPATSPSYDDGPNRDTEDPEFIEIDEDTSVATQDGSMTGYYSGGGLVSSAGSGGSADTGKLKEPVTSMVRQEPAAVVMKEVAAGNTTTPDAIYIEAQVGE